MAEWMWALVVLAVTVLLGVLYAFALVMRRRSLSHSGGAFELSLHRPTARGAHGWQLGLGRYVGDELQYFRIFSVWPRPAHVWNRRVCQFDGQRPATESERLALYPGQVIATIISGGVAVELAMAPEALVALQSWLEARPPGADWNSPRMP